MKRSEILKYITSEILDAIEYAPNIHQESKNYAKKYANDILDMLLGFDMLPPKTQKQEGIWLNEWDSE